MFLRMSGRQLVGSEPAGMCVVCSYEGPYDLRLGWSDPFCGCSLPRSLSTPSTGEFMLWLRRLLRKFSRVQVVKDWRLLL